MHSISSNTRTYWILRSATSHMISLLWLWLHYLASSLTILDYSRDTLFSLQSWGTSVFITPNGISLIESISILKTLFSLLCCSCGAQVNSFISSSWTGKDSLIWVYAKQPLRKVKEYPIRSGILYPLVSGLLFFLQLLDYPLKSSNRDILVYICNKPFILFLKCWHSLLH